MNGISKWKIWTFCTCVAYGTTTRIVCAYSTISTRAVRTLDFVSCRGIANVAFTAHPSKSADLLPGHSVTGVLSIRTAVLGDAIHRTPRPVEVSRTWWKGCRCRQKRLAVLSRVCGRADAQISRLILVTSSLTPAWVATAKPRVLDLTNLTRESRRTTTGSPEAGPAIDAAAGNVGNCWIGAADSTPSCIAEFVAHVRVALVMSTTAIRGYAICGAVWPVIIRWARFLCGCGLRGSCWRMCWCWRCRRCWHGCGWQQRCVTYHSSVVFGTATIERVVQNGNAFAAIKAWVVSACFLFLAIWSFKSANNNNNNKKLIIILKCLITTTTVHRCSRYILIYPNFCYLFWMVIFWYITKEGKYILI